MCDYTDQVAQVQNWLVNLPTRKLIALAAQHKLVSYANKTRRQLVSELEEKRDVQQRALEEIHSAAT